MNRLVGFVAAISAGVAVAQSSDPRALFTISPQESETGQVITFDGTFSFDRPDRTDPITWSWDVGGAVTKCLGGPNDGVTCSSNDDCGATSDCVTTLLTDSIVSFAYDSPGLKTIKLTVTDGDGNTGVTSRTIVVVAAGTGSGGAGSVNHLPTAVFTMSTSQTGVGEVVDFDASASSDEDAGDTLQFKWDFGDGATQGFSTTATASHTYSIQGTFEVRLFVCDQSTCDQNSTDASESFRQIEVQAAGSNLPPTAVIASGPRMGAVGESLTFDGQLSFDPNGDTLDYAWDVRFQGFLQDPVLTSVMTRTFDEVGTYEIELEVFDGRGGANRTGPITVEITPAPPVIEPPAGNPNPGNTLEEPQDSALQRPSLTTCGIGMIPAMFASLAGMLSFMVSRRRRNRSGA